MSTPDVGDIAWVDFNPTIGHEQHGFRPAVVVSPVGYNQRSRCILVCPVTTNVRPWPWKVDIPPNKHVTGAILVDQIKSIDLAARVKRVSGRLDPDVIDEVRRKLAALLQITVDLAAAGQEGEPG